MAKMNEALSKRMELCVHRYGSLLILLFENEEVDWYVVAVAGKCNNKNK